MQFLSLETVRHVISLAESANPVSDRRKTTRSLAEIAETWTPTAEEEELNNFVGSLSREELAELIAVMWLGRDNEQVEDFPDLVRKAASFAAGYPTGKSPLATYLQQGLQKLGH